MTLKYRPEIDGLRAIAVLAVVLFHAEFSFNSINPFQGGYLGVDVFFVISGYLITAIILREVHAQRFSFIDFYLRRARRILPALFIVMLVCMPVAWRLLLPAEFIDYSSTILSSLFFASNVWFWQGDSYWAETSALRPFLHTWSLSVEEQFYLFFPPLILLVWRFARAYLIWVFAIIFVVSLQLAEAYSVSSPQAAFYLLPMRAWELMAGALLAQHQLKRASSQAEMSLSAVGWLPSLLAILGLIMVIASIFLFSENLRHPSYISVIPVIGTVLLIRYSSESPLVKRLLSAKLMVAIGLISYSLYLWHFPVFAFARIYFAELSDAMRFLAILVSILLAILSYHLVEKPVRDKEKVSIKLFLSVITLVFMVLVVSNALVLKHQGVPKRFASFANLMGYELFDYRAAYLSHTCFLHPEDMTAEQPFAKCQLLGAGDEKPVMMVWGDSNAAHLIPGILDTYAQDYQIVIRTSSGCGAFIDFVEPKRPGCKEINDMNLEYVLANRPDRLIIAGLWRPKAPPLLKKTLVRLKESDFHAVEVIGPVPRWSLTLPRSVIAYGQRNPRLLSMPKYLKDPRHDGVFEIEGDMRAMVEDLDVRYRSMLDILCDEQRGCQTYVNDEQLVQWDFGHLTTVGAKFLMREMKLGDEGFAW